MLACKEQIIYFEELARRQKRIYPDSSDFGVLVDDKELSIARQMLKDLRQCYQSTVDKYHYGSTTRVSVTVEKDEGMYNGFYIMVDYNKDTRKKLQFLSISFANWRNETHSFKATI